MVSRETASNGQHGFLEELFYRTDLACHAGHGCGGTLSEGCGGTLSFPGISIFRERVSKRYLQCEVAQMHLVLAQHSVQSGGIQEASEIKEQLRKSIALSLKAAHKEKDTALVISGSCLSAQGEEIVSSETFAELSREVLIADMMQSGDGQFNCMFITMMSTQQEEVFHRCFLEWERKNLISVATQMDSISEAASNDATHISTDEKLGGTGKASQNEELVLVRPPQVDKVTLATWLDSSGFDDDDLLNKWSEEDDEGRELSWSQCPEAIMVHSTKLTEVILNKISHELKGLAKWMMVWDQQVESQDIEGLRDRGERGQCRQSTQSGVCHAWDPTKEGSRPKFKNQERLLAARFYGAIMDWAASKGRGLEFWKSSNPERPTTILRAIRAVWKKEKCQMDVLYKSEKEPRDHVLHTSLLVHLHAGALSNFDVGRNVSRVTEFCLSPWSTEGFSGHRVLHEWTQKPVEGRWQCAERRAINRSFGSDQRATSRQRTERRRSKREKAKNQIVAV